jgi:hypothetical protein
MKLVRCQFCSLNETHVKSRDTKENVRVLFSRQWTFYHDIMTRMNGRIRCTYSFSLLPSILYLSNFVFNFFISLTIAYRGDIRGTWGTGTHEKKCVNHKVAAQQSKQPSSLLYMVEKRTALFKVMIPSNHFRRHLLNTRHTHSLSIPGVINSDPARSGACWFSVLPDNWLHTPGVPGVNQSLIRREPFLKSTVELASRSRVEFEGMPTYSSLAVGLKQVWISYSLIFETSMLSNMFWRHCRTRAICTWTHTQLWALQHINVTVEQISQYQNITSIIVDYSRTHMRIYRPPYVIIWSTFTLTSHNWVPVLVFSTFPQCLSTCQVYLTPDSQCIVTVTCILFASLFQRRHFERLL